jgi:hypothetical protein
MAPEVQALLPWNTRRAHGLILPKHNAMIPFVTAYCTVKDCVVVKAPLGVVTVIGPVVAPSGTTAHTPWVEPTWKTVAGVPLKLTPVAPSRLNPHSNTCCPAAPAWGLKEPMCGWGLGRPRSLSEID